MKSIYFHINYKLFVSIHKLPWRVYGNKLKTTYEHVQQQNQPSYISQSGAGYTTWIRLRQNVLP